MHWNGPAHWNAHCPAEGVRGLILHACLPWSFTLPWTLVPQAVPVASCSGTVPQEDKSSIWGRPQSWRSHPHTTSTCSVSTHHCYLSLGWVPTSTSGNCPNQLSLVKEWLGCSIQSLSTMEARQHRRRKMPALSSLSRPLKKL